MGGIDFQESLPSHPRTKQKKTKQLFGEGRGGQALLIYITIKKKSETVDCRYSEQTNKNSQKKTQKIKKNAFFFFSNKTIQDKRPIFKKSLVYKATNVTKTNNDKKKIKKKLFCYWLDESTGHSLPNRQQGKFLSLFVSAMFVA